MRRKAVRKLLERMARIGANLRSSRRHLCERLAARPCAPRRAARFYRLVLDHLGAELAIVETDLTAAEDACSLARPRPTECRRQRDDATFMIRELYIPIRRLLGDLPVKGAAILAVLPASPAEFAGHLPLAIDVLRDLDRQPPWQVGGVTVDAGDLAGELEAALPTLAAALRALEEAEADLRMARSRADGAFARGEKVVSWVSEAVKGLRGLADS